DLKKTVNNHHNYRNLGCAIFNVVQRLCCGESIRVASRWLTFILTSSFAGFESAFISGSHDLLGKWNPSAGLPMVKDTIEENKWYIQIMLPVGEKIQYRFFSAISDPRTSPANPRHFITHYEGSLQPREIFLSDESETRIILCKFGEFEKQAFENSGWLTCQNEVLLTIDASMVRFMHPQKLHHVHLKVGAFRTMSSYEPQFSVEENPYDDFQESCWPSWYSHFKSHDCAFKENRNEMLSITPRDIWIFKAQFFTTDESIFKVEFFSISDEEGDSPVVEQIGTAIVLTSALQNYRGSIKLPICDVKNKVVGSFVAELLIIKPITDIKQTLERGFTEVKKQHNRTMNIGHRGVGQSCAKPCTLPENTIASFKAATLSGADFVEFDVQMTKDWLPVVYHDFFVKIWARKRPSNRTLNLNHHDDFSVQTIAVSDLTKDELDMLMMVDEQKFANRSDVQGNLNSEVDAELLPFPLLIQVLQHQSLPSCVGFMIEVKYPQKLKCGCSELYENYTERNAYVDVIVTDVLKNAHQRKIIFSSFDPDVCLMLKIKQNRYPVLFLTQGDNSRYEIYEDWRTWSSDTAVKFAFVHDLAGVAFHSEELLSNIAPYRRALKLNLATFVWGDDLDESRHREYFRNLHFDELIVMALFERFRREIGFAYLLYVDQIFHNKLCFSFHGVGYFASSFARACKLKNQNSPINHSLGLRKSSLFQHVHIKSYNSDGQRSTGGRSSFTNKLSFLANGCSRAKHIPKPSNESVTQIDLRYDNSRIGKANEPCRSRQF
ncbi:putative glycerophosphocholine phosphodiesterase GPCPD1 -like protein T05H10.7, partial [Trichinella sp. T6]